MLPHPAILWLITTDFDAANGYGAKMGTRNHCVALAEPQHDVVNSANPSGAFDDRVEHRLPSVGERLMMLRTSAVAV